MTTSKGNIKSLTNHIHDFISNLEYQDFMPPVNNDALRSKFENFFKTNNYYWKYSVSSAQWERWLFIEVKSFENNNPVSVGFLFSTNGIRYIVFNELLGSNFEPKHAEGAISLYKSWLDHNYLTTELTQVISKAIGIANTTNEKNANN
jgi:hypothetical protein